MKKFSLSFFTILIFTFYVLFTRNSEYTTIIPSPPEVIGNNQNQTGTLSEQSAQSEPPPVPVPQPSPALAPKPSAKLYKDGSYTGDAADAYYGNLQVEAIISKGEISDVQFLQYPNDRPHSTEISQRAMPLLKQEAIQAQSSNVDIVSGATQTSEAFRKSLTSALAQAKI